MGMILAVDGGGTKLSMMLIDNDFKLRGQGKSGGVNINQTSPEDSRKNVVNCLEQIFHGQSLVHIDKLYVVFVGPVQILYEELANYATVGETIAMSEAKAGLLAGTMQEEGVLALAGTGSDIFYVRDDQTLNSVVGGWGPILGDQGSGTWIGQRALRAIVAGIEGWGKPTKMYDLLVREWELKNDFQDMVSMVHRSIAPFRVVASLTRLVGEAARAGDPVALEILEDAGLIMAKQADCLIRREDIPEKYRQVVCCGGAWKTHPSMFNAFSQRLQDLYPNISIHKPWFEHVMGGPAYEILKQNIPLAKARVILEEQFPQYIIDW